MGEEQGGTIAGLPPWALVALILAIVLLTLGVLNAQRIFDFIGSIVGALVEQFNKIVSGTKIPGV